MPPARTKCSQVRKTTKPVSDGDDLILPPHTVRTTFRMAKLDDFDRRSIFHHIQQHCLYHHTVAHVDSPHPYGPDKVDEVHVIAERSDGLIRAVCGTIADTLSRPVRYRVGNVLDLVKPQSVVNSTHLSVTVVQSATGSPELHRRTCWCDGCRSHRSSASVSSCTSADDGAVSGGSRASRHSKGSSGGKHTRRGKRRSFFPFRGEKSRELSPMRASAQGHPSRACTPPSLSPTPTPPDTLATPTTPVASQPPPNAYLPPMLTSPPKSYPFAELV